MPGPSSNCSIKTVLRPGYLVILILPTLSTRLKIASGTSENVLNMPIKPRLPIAFNGFDDAKVEIIYSGVSELKNNIASIFRVVRWQQNWNEQFRE
eukprot:4240791-Amphidinium_carterae.1